MNVNTVSQLLTYSKQAETVHILDIINLIKCLEMRMVKSVLIFMYTRIMFCLYLFLALSFSLWNSCIAVVFMI